MRVIRYRGQAGTQIEVAGKGREPAPVVLARVLERKIGRGGGLRDRRPDGELRDGYMTVAVTKDLMRWAQRQADARGLSRSAFLGMLIEGAHAMSGDEIDEILAR